MVKYILSNQLSLRRKYSEFQPNKEEDDSKGWTDLSDCSSSEELDMLNTPDAFDPFYYVILKKVYDLLFKYTSSTNVAFVPGTECDEENELFYELSCHGDMDDLPVCHLCQEEFFPDHFGATYKENHYWMYFEGSCTIELHIKKGGMLQCCYCLNNFHRIECSLSMSDKSYCKALKERTWACPLCVPEFVPWAKNKAQRKCKDSRVENDYITKIFTLLQRSCDFMNVDENFFLDCLYKYGDKTEFCFDNG